MGSPKFLKLVVIAVLVAGAVYAALTYGGAAGGGGGGRFQPRVEHQPGRAPDSVLPR
ncbi:MAG TPA: hypothetical protein VGB83_07765 [Actinomycetota bacterium]